MCWQRWDLVQDSGREGRPKAGPDIQPAPVPHRGQPRSCVDSAEIQGTGTLHPSYGGTPQRCVDHLVPQNRWWKFIFTLAKIDYLSHFSAPHEGMLGSGGILNFGFTSWQLYSTEKSPRSSVQSTVGKLKQVRTHWRRLESVHGRNLNIILRLSSLRLSHVHPGIGKKYLRIQFYLCSTVWLLHHWNSRSSIA